MTEKQIEIKQLINPVVASVVVPGSKSDTNRALILAALTRGSVEITGHLVSDDTKAMIECLKRLGIKVIQKGKTLSVVGSIFDIERKKFKLNAGLSGTTIRFLTAMLCVVPGEKIIEGEEGLNRRPIKDLVDSLVSLGAEIGYVKRVGFPPLKISSERILKKSAKVKGDVSSQYLSALLMIAPLCGIEKVVATGRQISKSYVDLTLESMEKFGVEVKNNNYKTYEIPQKEYRCSKYFVEGDISAACYFGAVAALTGSTITINNCARDSIQGDREFFTLLENMGNKVSWRKNSLTIIGKKVTPITANMENCPDQGQTLAVLLSFTKGKSILKGIQSLRVKETERVKALETELQKMGIKTISSKNTITIFGGDPKPSEIDTYGDHRMAMSFAVAGVRMEGLKINNPNVVSKTFPDFWKELKKLYI